MCMRHDTLHNGGRVRRRRRIVEPLSHGLLYQWPYYISVPSVGLSAQCNNRRVKLWSFLSETLMV